MSLNQVLRFFDDKISTADENDSKILNENFSKGLEKNIHKKLKPISCQIEGAMFVNLVKSLE